MRSIALPDRVIRMPLQPSCGKNLPLLGEPRNRLPASKHQPIDVSHDQFGFQKRTEQ